MPSWHPSVSALRDIARGAAASVRRAPIAWVYLVIALSWGLAMVVVTPPFQVADEGSHYYRAWSVAQLELIPRDGMVVSIPENVATLPSRIGSSVTDWKDNHYSVGAAKALLWERIAGTQRDQKPVASGSGPIGYVPQAIGISVARALGHSPLLALYLGRIANLLASVVIAFLAIRCIPFGKPLLALVALLPMVVAEAASLGPDGLALCGFLLFLAITLRLSVRSCLRIRDLALLTGAAVILLNVKPGFVVGVFLVLMLRPRQFGSVKRYVGWVFAIVATSGGFAALVMLTAPHAPAGYVASIGMGAVDQGRQLAFVLQHPWAFAKVVFRSMDQSLILLTQGGYGILGWLTVGLPTIGMCALALAAILFMGYRENVMTTPWQRVVLAATAMLLVGVVALALYVGWSPVGAPVIYGLQGRYFIPAAALILFATYGIRPRREVAVLIILAGAVGVAAITTIAALLSYYY